MHLLDMPKPDRPHRLPNKFLAVISGLCLGMSLLTIYSDSTGYTCRYPVRMTEPRPVQWVTVKTSRLISDRGRADRMPLIELYEELRQMEDKAETELETMPMAGEMTNAEQEQIYLRKEKAFMQKYGLTEKQVAMIKREGSLLRKEARDE
jgi:hypothetical protein